MKTIKNETDNQTGNGNEVDSEADINELLRVVEVAAAETERSQKAAHGASVTEIAAGWVAPRYLQSLRGQLASQSDRVKRSKLLRQAIGDVVALQRGGVWAARLQLERERLELQWRKHRDNLKAARDERRLARRKGKDKQIEVSKPMTAEEELRAIADKVDEVMGLKPRKKPEARIQEPGFNGELSTEGNEGGEGGELHG